MRAGAPVPFTGRYAMQGRQMAAGLRLWAHRSAASLVLEDDQSRPERAVSIFRELSDQQCDLVLGPYGSDSVRAVAAAAPEAPIWNHGAAADDVQWRANVVSLPTPASRYLVALGRLLAQLRPGAAVAVVAAGGRFADHAWRGFRAEAGAIGLEVVGRFTFSEAAAALHPDGVDAVLAVGPVAEEVTLFRQLAAHGSSWLLGGVSPGLAGFADALGGDPEGLLAPVQWHPSLGRSPALGPGSAQVLDDARLMGMPGLDYVAAQAYAAALVASHCQERHPGDPGRAARQLRTSTFFGDFELDPQTGAQRGHRLAVVRWRAGRPELLAGAAA